MGCGFVVDPAPLKVRLDDIVWPAGWDGAW
jgi:hypothetical protein